MRIKPLLLSLGILGTSSVALADNTFGRDRRVRNDDISSRYRSDDISARYRGADISARYRDRTDARFRDNTRFRDRDLRDRDVYRPRTTWLPLTSLQHLDRGDSFDIDARERFVRLRLQNQTGRTAVRAIIVEFGNGQRQRFEVNRVLSGNHDMVNIELSGTARRIEQIIVLGDSRRSGTYQLYAM